MKRIRSWLARLSPRSLTGRAIAFSTIWAVLALVVISTIISTLYRQATERGFDSLLSAHLFNLIGSVGVAEDGVLSGSPDLGDLRFSEPNSGWYWSVEPVSANLAGALRSPSMTQAIASPSVVEVPFDGQFQRSYLIGGIAGEQLEVIENEFLLGGDNRIARFRVMGNRTEMEAQIDAFERQLYTWLSAFGGGMIAVNAIAILLGLRPLNEVSNALAQVREGTARRLDGRFPREIQPLADETNALIENNRRIVERARTQVGNLAHSLKTPLAVLINEGRALGGDRGRLIEEQTSAMKLQIDHYLQRARIAAQRDSVVYRTPVSGLLARMVRVMGKLNPGTRIALDLPPEDILFAGEKEDLEEIVGNLLENAIKWARSSVRVRLSPLPSDGTASRLLISIADDGPGIPEEHAREALKRGRRLDETKPGTGLGLAIVADLVNEYGGRLSLERSDLGGLDARVELRALG